MLYRFDKYLLNTKEKNLWLEDELINLSPRVYDTLQMLVERSGEVTTKEEMLESIWNGAFVEENNLSQKISILRKTFGKDNNFIETIPRKGFRFIEPVKLVDEVEIKNGKVNKSFFPDEKKEHTEKALSKPSEGEVSFFSKRLAIPAVISAVVVSVLIFVGFNYYRSEKRKTISPPPFRVELLTKRGEVRFPMISPDGDTIAFVKPNSSSIFLKDIQTNDDTEIKVEETLFPGFLKFSPDEKHIYFRERKRQTEPSHIYKVSKFGGVPKLVLEDSFAQFDISPDGTKIVFIRKNNNENQFELVIKVVDSDEESVINTKKFPLTYDWRSPPSWSPDGKMIAVTHGESSSDFSNLSVIDIASKAETPVKTEGLRRTSQTLWMGSKSELLLLGEGENLGGIQVFRISYPSGDRKKLTNEITNYKNLSISKDGKRIAARTHGIYSNVWLYPEGDSNRKKQLTDKNGIEGLFGLTWTPNNKIVHFQRRKEESQIQILDPTDRLSRVLASNTRGVTQFPFVTADNKNVFYQSTEKGITKIKSVHIENGRLEIFNSDNINPEIYPVVSPDDKYLYFIERGVNGAVIRRQSVESREKTIVLKDAKLSMNSFLSISPDGKYLAFNTELREKDAKTKIGFIDLDNDFRVKYLSVPLSRPYIQWTTGGKTFDYFNDTKNGSQLWRQSFTENSEPELITETVGEKIYYFSWSNDEESLALSIGNNKSDAVLFEFK